MRHRNYLHAATLGKKVEEVIKNSMFYLRKADGARKDTNDLNKPESNDIK